MKADDALNVGLTVCNIGQRAGFEIVQLYVHHIDSQVHMPEQELAGFAKIYLEPGESKKISIQLDDKAFSFYEPENRAWKCSGGKYQIRAGSSSRDIHLSADLEISSDYKAEKESDIISSTYKNLMGKKMVVSDAAFSALLGYKVPFPETSRPFHENSTLNETRDTWLGKILYKAVMNKAKKDIGEEEKNETMKLMRERAVGQLPLRGIVLLTGGQIGFRVLNGIIAVLNGKYLKALGHLFK